MHGIRKGPSLLGLFFCKFILFIYIFIEIAFTFFSILLVEKMKKYKKHL